MKKRLMAVYVASALAGIGGVSSIALTSTNRAPTPGGIWTNGGSGRRKRGTGHRRSPAERIAEQARARRQGGYYTPDFSGLFVALIVVGVIIGLALSFIFPVAWSAIKPLLHALTA